jgi:hypothetical protein
MSLNEEPFVPSDPTLYGPDPASPLHRSRPLRDVLGLSPRQFISVVVLSLLLFAFLGGPFWSAARTAFPLRLFASYLVIPVLVVPLLWSNRALTWPSAFAASAAAAAIKFAVTVVIDVVRGLLGGWPP